MYFTATGVFEKKKDDWFVSNFYEREGKVTGIAKNQRDAFDFAITEQEADQIIAKCKRHGQILTKHHNKQDDKRAKEAEKKAKKGAKKKQNRKRR